MTQDQKSRVLKDAMDALDSARTKVMAAGLMLANGFGKEHKSLVALRAAVADLVCAREHLKIEREIPPPAVVL